MKCELIPRLKIWSDRQRELSTLRIHIDILTICKNKCPYCYSRADTHNWGKFMSKDYINDTLLPNLKALALHQAKQGKFLDVVLLGGEPTLHPMLNDMISFILSLPNTRMSITTNGSNGYNNAKSNKNLRWGVTFHPSQVKDVDVWLKNVIERKDDFWEVTVHPFSDCWGDDELLKKYSSMNKHVIDVCLRENIKIQPVFQYDPRTNIRDHRVDLDKLRTFYPYLNDLEAFYVYDDKEINDYQMVENNLNFFEGWDCINNSVTIDVTGEIQQCCSYKVLSWDDLYTYDASNFKCPLPICTCIGFLSLYKSKE